MLEDYVTFEKVSRMKWVRRTRGSIPRLPMGVGSALWQGKAGLGEVLDLVVESDALSATWNLFLNKPSSENLH